jgi:transcriptional regulator with PAS, ATPase and Fis domain
LLESELFGYKAGAFTHATRDKLGLFAQATGGTLLLDEIGDLSAAFQMRLLRVLQERRYQPLGATKPLGTDERVIAATNKDLADLVKKGLFRQDLYYRVNVVALELPPLRRRKEDIPMLVEHFVGRMNRLHSKSVTGISQEALSLLMFHDYPGNIRELENIIEHAFVICPRGELSLQCLPEGLKSQDGPVMPSAKADQPGGMAAAVRSTEAQVIQDTLVCNNYNRTAAARTLNIQKSTLYRKIRRLGLNLPPVDGRAQPDSRR